MTKSHAVLVGPFLIATIATIFCVWTALGNEVNICITTGCTLYQDVAIAGISLWWIGAAAFITLAACALLGLGRLGKYIAALFLLGDISLLIIMALTAPCINCLIAAFFFALCYFFFRRLEAQPLQRQNPPQALRPSIILWVWIAFFVINLGQVIKSQFDVWPIYGESSDARARMFFSPSCPRCVEGINELSGNVEYAFYPVAENEDDIFRLAEMERLLSEGQNLSDALNQSADVEAKGFFAAMQPDMLLLRFRVLCNKAHIFADGSQGVPYFEIKGLPSGVIAKIREKNTRKPLPVQTPSTGDATLPEELSGSEQCTGQEPCPPSIQ